MRKIIDSIYSLFCEHEVKMMDWNYDMESCLLDTKVRLLSSDDCPLLSQMEYVGTITFNGRFKTRGECYEGDKDYFYRSAIVVWKKNK